MCSSSSTRSINFTSITERMERLHEVEKRKNKMIHRHHNKQEGGNNTNSNNSNLMMITTSSSDSNTTQNNNNHKHTYYSTSTSSPPLSQVSSAVVKQLEERIRAERQHRLETQSELAAIKDRQDRLLKHLSSFASSS